MPGIIHVLWTTCILYWNNIQVEIWQAQEQVPISIILLTGYIHRIRDCNVAESIKHFHFLHGQYEGRSVALVSAPFHTPPGDPEAQKQAQAVYDNMKRMIHVHVHNHTRPWTYMAFCGGQCGQCLTTVYFGCRTSSTYTSLFTILFAILLLLLIDWLIDLLFICLYLPPWILLCVQLKNLVRESLTCVLYARCPATLSIPPQCTYTCIMTTSGAHLLDNVCPCR